MTFQLLLAVFAGGLSFVIAGVFIAPLVYFRQCSASQALATISGCAIGSVVGRLILDACGVSL